MKYRNKWVSAVLLAVMLTSVTLGNIGYAEVIEPDNMNSDVQMLTSPETEDMLAVIHDTDEIENTSAEAVDTDVMVSSEDFGVAVKGDMAKAGDAVMLQVSAANRGQEAVVLKICFWDYAGALPEEKEAWAGLLTTYCSHVTAEGLPVFFMDANGEVLQGDVQFVQEKQEGMLTASYLMLEVPAGCSTDFEVPVVNLFAETITIVPMMTSTDKEICGDAVAITWNEEDVLTESTDENLLETEMNQQEHNDIIQIEKESMLETEVVSETEAITERIPDQGSEKETSAEYVTEGKTEPESESETLEILETEALEDISELESGTEQIMQDTEMEHFLEAVEGVEKLDPQDFVSQRLLVLAAEETIIVDPEHLIGAYDGIYLLEYDTVEQSMNAYLHYLEHAEAVEPDSVINAASEESYTNTVRETESVDYLVDLADDIVTEQDNPITLLSNTEASVTVQELEKREECVIALIDTGVQPGEHIIDTISFADDKLYGGTHGEDMAKAIVSQNPDAKILSIRALNDNGYGTVSSIVAAIEYAVSQKVDIINLSMSARKTLSSSVLESVIGKASDKGIIVIGAAGNRGEDAANFMPGAIESVYIMGACTKEGVRQNSSNFGATVDGYIVAKSTSEATALMSGYVSANDITAMEKFALFHKEATEPEEIEIEEPDISKEESDEAIFDAVIENYVKENVDTAYTTVEKMELAGILPVKNTLVDAENTSYDMTIDRLMSTDYSSNLMESFITQVNTFVAVYDLSDNSDYYVAYADTMHADTAAEVIDSEMAYFNSEGEEFSDYHYDKYTGLVYIPKYHYVVEGKKYDDAVQIQLLQRTFLDSSFSVNSHVTAVVDDTEEVDVSSNSENAFMYATNIKVQKDLDLETLVVSVNGIPIPNDMYAYDPVNGNLGVGLSTAAIQNISVFCDGRDFEQEMAAAGVSYAQMKACNKQGKLADIDFKALSVKKTYEGTIEAKRDAKVSDSDEDNMYRVDGSYSDGEYQKTLADIILYLAGLTSNASGIHGNTSSGNLVHTDDGSWVMAISSITIPGQPIKFEQLKYDNKHVRMDTTCAHIANKDYAYGGLTEAERRELKKRYPDYFSDEAGDEGADIVQNNRGKWFRIPILLRPLYIYKSPNPEKEDSYVVMAMCTQRTATQNGAGIFKVKVKEKEVKPPMPPTKPANLYIAKTSAAEKEIMDLEPYSLEGAEFSVTAPGFSEVLKTDKFGNTNSVELPDNSTKEWKPSVYDKDGNLVSKGYWTSIPKTTTYTIKETKPPKGHKVTSTPQTLRVTMPRDEGKEIKLKFENEPIFCENEFEIEKLDAKGNPIEGVIFEVKYYDAPDASDKKKLKRIWYLESDTEGKVRFDEAHLSTRFEKYKSDEFFRYKGEIVIPINGYLEVKEVAVPASFILDDASWGMPTGEKVKLTKRVYNDYEPGTVHLRKFGSDKVTPLPDVEFKLKFVSEKLSLTTNKKPNFKRLLEPGQSIVKSTDENGNVEFSDLDHGTYEITEIKTQSGQILLKDKITFEIPVVMTKEEMQAHENVDYEQGKSDVGYTDHWFFFEPIYEVTNTISFKLPMTGSIGTWKYGFVGMGVLVVLGIGGVIYEYIKRKQR